jgi:predicted outer membrane repeat protein
MMIFIGRGAAFPQGTITVTTNADDGAGSLRQAIVDAVDGDVINFDPAITSITFNSTLNLGDKTLTIDGGGNVILHREVLALDSFRLVTITGVLDKEVTLTRLTIENGFSKDHGGGLSADNSTGGKTILDNLIFKNNTAVNNGGGAYVVGFAPYGNVINNCEFVGNKALHITLGRGGALFPKNATITGSTFIENECGDSGGAIFSDNDVAIYDSEFIGNATVDDAGGAIRLQGNNGYVRNSTFESNFAKRTAGAIFMAKGNIYDCTFINNSSDGDAGGVFANGVSNMYNCVFIGNSTPTNGGGLYVDDDGLVQNCIITNNTSGSNGGGAYLRGGKPGNLIGSVIANNVADSIGGGVYIGKGNVINSTITKNFAGKNGGALSGDGSWLIANSIVFDNDAAGADKNIQVVSNTAALAAANCAIDATAYNAAGWTATNITTLDASPFVGGTGADSLMVPYSSALIDAGTTDHGVADLLPATDLNGGNRIINGVVDLGPYERLQSFVVTTDADDGAGSLRQMIADAIDGESIITFADGITSIKVGRPLELGDKTLIIDGEGDVILDGALTGAVETDIYRVVTITGTPGKQVTIKNLTIQNGFANSANGGGLSAVHSAGGQTILDGLTFQNNVANGSGGAVSIIGYNLDTLCIINNCEFIGNKTNEGNNFNGGGVNADYTEISGCTFIDNESGYNAGALVMSRVFVYDSHFEGNTCLSSGGAARIGNVAGTITNSTFHANSSVGNGGAVFMARGNLYNCEFTNNSGTEGGAVYANQNECIIDHCTFSENSASTNGGAVWIDDAGKMTNSIVTNNSAALVGGGVYIRLGGSAVGSVLAYNTADSIGGGIHVVNAKVINTIITKNYAGKNGGALSGNGNWFLANSIVFDNDAAGADKNIQVVSNTAATAAANSAIDATAYNPAAWTATNIVTLDASPFVGGTGADSLYSLTSSGLIDAGTLDYGIEALLPATDLDGNDRIQGVIDMGVYETSIIGVLGVTLDRSSLRLSSGTTGTLVATVEPDFATDKSVTWSSSNESVATVADGVVTAVSDGTATITVTTVNGGFTATCNVTVYTPVTGVSLNEEAITLEVSETFTLVATITPAGATDQTVGWVSGNQSVATVNNSGLVTAVSAGTATISVVTVDGSFIATCDVTVIEPSIAVTGVSLDQTTLALEPGNTATLVATVAPGDATDKSVSWTSSNEAVATVADGVVTAVADGTCTITVTTTDGGFTATCDVTVETVGLKHFEAGFTIYPNPVRNNIFIEGENIHSVTIYSLTGAPVMIVEEGFSKGINVASMESGMYILKIKTDKGTGVTTIVKE